jgi:hypothetical protein
MTKKKEEKLKQLKSFVIFHLNDRNVTILVTKLVNEQILNPVIKKNPKVPLFV